MKDEFTDTSGKYGAGARCLVCHCTIHDEETGPLCDAMQLEQKVKELEIDNAHMRRLLDEIYELSASAGKRTMCKRCGIFLDLVNVSKEKSYCRVCEAIIATEK